jgi:hypothetical protein
VCSVPSNVNYSNGMMAGVVPSNEYFPPRLCKRVSAAYRDKNEIRRAVAQAKREERKRQAGLIREQEVQKKEATQTLLSSVNKVEQQPTRTAKKYSSETKVTIKRHSKNKGYLEALVQVGQAKEVWLPVFVFWQPHYILSYLPEWHVYCKKKVLPDEWKYNPDRDPYEVLGTVQGLVEKDAGTSHFKVPTTEVKVEKEEAECIGHVLNTKGRVWMKLRWLDEKVPDSIHAVQGVMISKPEKTKFGKTWMEYCSKIGLEKDLEFSEMGYSVVKSIIGHEWLECGRPVVEIEWRHGERSKGKVMDVLETCKAQKNGFNHQWSVYCDNLGDISPGMRKGFMDRSRRITVPVVTNKRRRSG